jgi:hypothetical protein
MCRDLFDVVLLWWNARPVPSAALRRTFNNITATTTVANMAPFLIVSFSLH